MLFGVGDVQELWKPNANVRNADVVKAPRGECIWSQYGIKIISIARGQEEQVSLNMLWQGDETINTCSA